MAIKLKQGKSIPAITLNKVHVLSWLQTEKKEKPYTLSVQATVILYGKDGNDERVYDPSGPQHINIKDWRAFLGEHLSKLEPAEAGKVLAIQADYVKALAYMIGIATTYGEAEV